MILLIAGFTPHSDGVFAQSVAAQRVADTSSPRATLATFLDSVDIYMSLSLDATVPYLQSDRYYPNDREKRLIVSANAQAGIAVETLDLSRFPSGFREALAIESVVLMVDVIARIDMPDLSDVPDHEAMVAADTTNWKIPGTRIELALVTEGPRIGEYLFSPETVANLKGIHQRLAHVPPRQESVKRYFESLHPFTSDTTLHDLWRNSAVTFDVLPERWSFEMPDGLKAHFLGATIWQWLSILVCEIIGLFLIWLSWYVGGRLGASRNMRMFVTSIFVLIYAALATTLLQVLQIGGTLLFVVGLASVVLLYLAATWTVFAGANAVAETIIRRQRLRTGGADGQLIRLGARLIALAVSVLLIVRGTSELGFPAYSLLTGFGVSGLAIALAARDTLSNLLGSISIMFEKPFRSHDWIKVGDAEGSVERIGFRSTRIRTVEDSIISIPNNLVVNTMVDNMGARGRRHQCLTIHLSNETSRDSVKAFVSDVQKILTKHEMTSGEDHRVHLSGFGEDGLAVLVDFHLTVSSYDIELRERETILFDILESADGLGLKITGGT